jgi:hypothetical protein
VSITLSTAAKNAAANSIMNNAAGVPAGYVMKMDANGTVSWVPPQLVGSITGTSSSHHGIDPMPETQRSFDAEAEIRALCKTVREQAEEMQAQYRLIEKLRAEMDELHGMIQDNRSRQLNGAGYWDEA